MIRPPGGGQITNKMNKGKIRINQTLILQPIYNQIFK